MESESQRTHLAESGIAKAAQLTPRGLSLYLFGLGLGISVCLVSLLSRTTRDQATVLGRYSPGYAALLVIFLLTPVVLMLLALFALRSQTFVRQVESRMMPLWRQPVVVFVLLLPLLAAFVGIFTLRVQFFRQYPMAYE